MSWSGFGQGGRQGNWLCRLTEGLRKSSARLVEGLDFTRKTLDQAALDELEDLLIRADMGPAAAARIVSGVSEGRFNRDVSEEEVRKALAAEIARLLRPREGRLDLAGPPKPRVVLVVGVNGSGKTTTIGKLAAKLRDAGSNVVIGAADTFRAAAIEQLEVWAKRAGADFVSKEAGADSAGVAFDAVARAQQTAADVVLIDTAGRLQTKSELMAELPKIVRVIRKLDEDSPHETLMVLDATVGQNALSQMEAFRSAIDLSGLVLTKLDGTAKGGVLVAIADRHAIPVHFIGVGEGIDDLQPFAAEAFAQALVGTPVTEAPRSEGVRALAALPSLGLVSARMLEEAGVRDPETLKLLGPLEAWRRLRFHFGRRATVNFVYAMECAVRGIDWRLLKPERMAELKIAARNIAAQQEALVRRPTKRVKVK